MFIIVNDPALSVSQEAETNLIEVKHLWEAALLVFHYTEIELE